MSCGIEVTVVVGRIIQHVNIPVQCRPPFDKLQQGLRIGFQHTSVRRNFTQDSGADRENHTWRIIPSGGKYMVDQPSMQAPVAIHEWVDVHKAKGCRGRRNNWIDTPTPCVGIIRNNSLDQVAEILGPRTDMVWNRLLGLPVVHSNEAAFSPQSKPNKPVVANDNLLQPLQFRQAK